MKFLFAGILITSLAPVALHAGAVEDAKSICSIVDRYTQGSYHYFECLDRAELINTKLNVTDTIDYVCSVVDTFYNLDAEDKIRCYKDAQALLNPEPLACYPEQDVLSSKFESPEGFDPDLVAGFRALAIESDKEYSAKVYGNNGLVSDLQKAEEGCFSEAYAVSLDGPNPFKDALKECVFTDINAYSGPAVTADDQEELAASFVKKYWELYRFRKIVNASLQNDPITAFNTRCVVEVRSRSAGLQNQRLYLAGYTID
ncbi:MAG TPA: hypothetical protein VFO10_23520 [Oligoflexus sp.]|uniref:hypothetical protein n=1 Tax=Oligoflexus sp. TaxID=1971216 RepID=UPI002D7F6703|nr:hypothetical protein [Oligoflexus sp.]HET9240253.1 hypothetical protein [Oligoflexus sp.]